MTGEMPQWQLAGLAIEAGGLLGMALDRTWAGSGVRLGAEGNGLYLHEPYKQRGRVAVSGWFPVTSYGFGKSDRLAITVRADRGPRAIAAEVTSRLLPAYRATVAKIREHDARQRADQQARDALAAYITGLFPGDVATMPGHCQSGHRSEIILHLPGLRGGAVKFHGDGAEVEFDRFRVPASVALRMLETAALLAST